MSMAKALERDLDEELNQLLLDEHPPPPSVASIGEDERIEALERRVEALERALEGALDAFQALATERIREAAMSAAHAVQAYLDPSVVGGGEDEGEGEEGAGGEEGPSEA